MQYLIIAKNDILLGIDLEGIITSQPEILVFDRFDMYDENASVLEKLKDSGIIVLVDYKTQRHFCNFDDTCWITLTEYSLEVSL